MGCGAEFPFASGLTIGDACPESCGQCPVTCFAEPSAGSSVFDVDLNGALDTYNLYLNSGSVTARVSDDQGNDIGAAGDYLLAYVGEELRGVGAALEIDPDLGNGFAFLTLIYSNAASGEIVNFKFYDHKHHIHLLQQLSYRHYHNHLIQHHHHIHLHNLLQQ
jgi:hypothetical protein